MRMNKNIKENVIYEGRICRFTHNEVEFEDGSTGYRDVLHLAGAVAILAFDDNDNTFLVDQYRHAVSDQLLELPAGMLENNEDPVEAALRELEEETGYTAHEIEPLCSFYTSPGVVHEKIYIYVARNLEHTAQHLDADEFLKVKRVHISELERMILNNEITDGKTILAYSLYKLKKSQ